VTTHARQRSSAAELICRICGIQSQPCERLC